MSEFDTKKSSVQKLAETLKRCGIASSVTDAHRIAGDITTTEKRVQNFFDQKKKEIHQDLLNKVHPNRPEHLSVQEKQIQSLRQQAISQSAVQAQQKHSLDIKHDTVKEMIERAKNPRPLTIQVDFETPNVRENAENPVDSRKEIPQSKNVEEEKKTLEEVLAKKEADKTPNATPSAQVLIHEAKFSHDGTLPQDKSLNELYEYHDLGKNDYINNFISNDKEEISCEEKEEAPQIKTEVAVQDEKIEIVEQVETNTSKVEETKPAQPEAPKVDLANYFGAKKEIKQEAQVQAASHPSPAQKAPAPGFDLHNFFNFAKKQKV